MENEYAHDEWVLMAELFGTTDYRLNSWVSMHDLFDGRLHKFGIVEKAIPGKTSEIYRLLVDDRGNCLWVNAEDDALVGVLTWYGSDDPEAVLRVIAQAFGTSVYSQDDPHFYGFNSDKELDAELRKL